MTYVFILVGIITLLLAAIPYSINLALIRVLGTTGSPADKGTYEPTVSVVLPTYNEESIIKSRLENLLKIEYPTEKLEIVIVDSGEDNTAKIAREFLAETGLDHTVIEEDERRGVAAAVNLAIAEASGEIIFRTDCDSYVAEDALGEAVRNFADPAIGAVTGRQSEVLGGSTVERDYRDLQTQLQQLESHLDSTFIVHGPCFLFRRSLFRDLPHASLADDTERAVNIRRQGYRIVLDPTVRFAESGTSEFSGRRQRKDRRAMGLLDLLRRSRDMLGKHGLYGWYVMPMNVWMMWGSPWLSVFGAVLIFIGSLSLGPVALVFPLLVVSVFYFGQREMLGPIQPMYVLADSLFSLLVASLRLRQETDGLWTIDQASREVFE